jgi:hypothetical protein
MLALSGGLGGFTDSRRGGPADLLAGRATERRKHVPSTCRRLEGLLRCSCADGIWPCGV